jgi:type IV pilus assembly protein PilB
MGVESYLVASTVKVIIAQRLVRQICPDCREKYKLSQEEIKDLSKTFDLEKILGVLKFQKVIDPKIKNWSELDFFKGKGCEHCRQKGYKGRIGIFEILEITDNVALLINKESTSDIINQEAVKENMVTILQDGFIKAARGITTIEEVLRVTRE